MGRVADEDDLAVFGDGRPGEGPGEFVGGDFHAAKTLASYRGVASQVLDEGLAVEGGFDAVFGVAFGLDAVDDVSALVGELHASAKAAGDVEIAGLIVKGTAEAGGVVGLGRG